MPLPSAYSTAQISHYLNYIALPPQYHPAANPTQSLPYLTALLQHQLARIPYENLSLHYSAAHAVVLDPQVLFEKMTRNGRGGYCMEVGIFFNHVLRALGWDVYSTGVRVRPRDGGVPKGPYLGWVHMINIVTLPTGEKYVLDVAFGGDGPTLPLQLIPGVITRNIGAQTVRFIYEPIQQQTLVSQPHWIYQYRNSDDAEWNSHYCFREQEFIEADYEVMSYFAGTSPRSFQTFTVVGVKFLLADVRDVIVENGEGQYAAEAKAVLEAKKSERKSGIYGKVMVVNGEFKLNDGGKTRVVEACRTEEERVMALKKWFGITLTDEEIAGIRGGKAELLGK